jgi:hypothetical protein
MSLCRNLGGQHGLALSKYQDAISYLRPLEMRRVRPEKVL